MNGMILIIYIFIYHSYYHSTYVSFYNNRYISYLTTLFISQILSYLIGIFVVYLGEATMFTVKIKLFCANIHAKRVVEDILLLSKNAFFNRISTVETGTHSWPHLSVWELSQNIICCDVSCTRCVSLSNVQHLLILTVIIYQII